MATSHLCVSVTTEHNISYITAGPGNRAVKLLWIFPRVPLTSNKAPGNTQGKLDRYEIMACYLSVGNNKTYCD